MELHLPEASHIRSGRSSPDLDPIQRALQENEDWYRDLVEHSCDLLCIHDLEGRLLSVNPAPARVLGYTVPELLQIPMREIIAPEFRPQFDAYLRQMTEVGESSGLMLVVTRSGQQRIWKYHNTLRREGVASPIVRGIAHDVTEQMRAERALREAAQLNAQIVAGVREGIVLFDQDLRCQVWNHFMEELTGKSSRQVLGKRAEEVFPGAKQHPVYDLLVRSMQGERVEIVDTQDPTLPGAGWISARYSPIRNTKGEISGVIAAVDDITERKQAEERLRQYERVVESLDEMIVLFDREYRFVLANRAFLKYRGLEKDQLIGRTAAEVWTPPLFENVLKQKFDACLAAGLVTFEMQYEHSRLGARDLAISCLPIEGPTGVTRIACILQEVTEKKRAEEELRSAKEKLAEEKLYLEEEIHTELGFGEIVGQSPALKAVIDQASYVASSDATVLLLGETGTGKELIARAIHRLSPRRDCSFIKLNCAAIPSGLLESELFGHEKGAFTGAISKKVGRLELADKGTLFLDEIGEIPLSLQPKLLRVLQDHEFERLGSTQTLRVNFRLVAATNRDLVQSMNDKQFRSDLYYRLSVFPLRVPPLRERREDIRLLVEHFVQRFSKRMNRTITSIPKKTMDILVRWDWPGNIRELENFIERSVILSHGSVLNAPISELMPVWTANRDSTLEAAERQHIVRALRESRGQLSGPAGAATRLGLPRSTLQSKLKQLGIDPQRFRV